MAKIVATLQGLPNHEKATRRAYIGFEPGSDIQIGDVVINPANERFHIIDVRNSFVRAIQIKAYSLSETEYTQSREKHETAVYNIGNAYGSVIGNSSNATINYQMGFQEMRERAAFGKYTRQGTGGKIDFPCRDDGEWRSACSKRIVVALF